MKHNILFYDEIASTHDDCLRRVKEGAEEGLTVVADRQGAGYGRLGRAWQSPPEVGLYVTTIVKPRENEKLTLFPLMAGVAMLEAMFECVRLQSNAVERNRIPLALKWPNDILLNGYKVCGILTEALCGMVVVSAGVNVLTRKEDLPTRALYPASSILEETGIALDRVKLLDAWLDKIATLRQGDIVSRWNPHDALRGKPVCVNTPTGEVAGIGAGIDADGALLLRQEDGTLVQVVAGDVR